MRSVSLRSSPIVNRSISSGGYKLIESHMGVFNEAVKSNISSIAHRKFNIDLSQNELFPPRLPAHHEM